MTKKVQQLNEEQKEAIADALADFFVEFFESPVDEGHQLADSDGGSAGNYPVSESAN